MFTFRTPPSFFRPAHLGAQVGRSPCPSTLAWGPHITWQRPRTPRDITLCARASSPATRTDAARQHVTSLTARPACVRPPAPQEKVMIGEAVHPISSWGELKGRLAPGRRVYAVTHPSMPQEPLVVLHTALLGAPPSSIQEVLPPSCQTPAAPGGPPTPKPPLCTLCCCGTGLHVCCSFGCPWARVQAAVVAGRSKGIACVAVMGTSE